MAMLKQGDAAPEFTLANHDGVPTSMEQHRGHYVVLWFYPKADTPG